MTGPDDSPDGFLERWSRRKIEAEREPAPSAESGAADAPLPDRAAQSERPAGNDITAVAKAAPQAGFDLASLPSLDSIAAGTDIRKFLSPGVPKELAHAALRRAWSADPAIRDFVGLAENAWDFTDPAAMPGFGLLPEGTDIKKLVAQIFGEGEKLIGPKAEEPVPSSVSETAGAELATAQPAVQPEARREQDIQDVIVQRDNNIAAHNSCPQDEADEPKHPRQHGGALPK